MKTATIRKSLESYKEANRKALEPFIEKAAKIEQVLDIEPGSLLEGLLDWMSAEDVESLIDYVDGAYELRVVPNNWREQVREIVGA